MEPAEGEQRVGPVGRVSPLAALDQRESAIEIFLGVIVAPEIAQGAAQGEDGRRQARIVRAQHAAPLGERLLQEPDGRLVPSLPAVGLRQRGEQIGPDAWVGDLVAHPCIAAIEQAEEAHLSVGPLGTGSRQRRFEVSSSATAVARAASPSARRACQAMPPRAPAAARATSSAATVPTR